MAGRLIFRWGFIFITSLVFLSLLIPAPLEIIIYKSKRKLYLMQQLDTIAAFDIVLGFAPTGDKFHEGDGKTPEGMFKIKSKYPHQVWRKFIWLDYPNKKSHSKYNQRKKKGLIPAGKKIGGEIGIHGVPEGMDALIDTKNDWTLGCISLRNKHIDSLYKQVSSGTVIYINP